MTSFPRALAALLAAAAFAPAQTVVNVPCNLDNTLYESATGALSNGRGDGLFVGVTGSNTKRRTLVRFDVAGQVPSGARVIAAQLELTVSRTGVAFVVNANVHRVLRAWGEGTSNAPGQEGGGTATTTGDATWLHSVFPSQTWTTPGGDFAPTPSAVMPTPTIGTGSTPTTAGLAADVQFWVDNPSQNFGWLLKTDEQLAFVARRFDSREAAIGTPPRLVVTYLLPGQAGTWGTGCPVGGSPFAFAFSAAPIGGTTIAMQQTNGPANSIGANLLALSLDPIGTPLLPACNLYLPFGGAIITQSLVTLGPTGSGTTPFAVPAGFPGVSIVAQSAALDGSPAGYTLSNAAIAILQ